MKLRNLFFSGLVLIGLFACNDNGNTPNVPSGDEKAYFSLKLSFPESTRATTTDEDGDGYQQGLGTEQRFQSVVVVLVGEDNRVTDYLTYTASDFAPDGNSAADDNNISQSQFPRLYESIEPRKVTKGNSRVYVCLNPTDEIPTIFAVGKAFTSEVLEMTPLTSINQLTTGIAQDDNFFMSNADTPEFTNIEGGVNDPTLVRIAVERMAVKLVENTPIANFDISNTHGATTLTATLANYNYNNLNKRSYYMKIVEPRSDNGAYAGSYVVDPNFIESDYLANAPSAPWYGNDFFVLSNPDVNIPFTTTPAISYALENTMISNEQYYNKTTSIVYQATISIDGAANSTFYTYKSVIYTSYADLEVVYNADYPAEENALQNLFTEAEMNQIYQQTGPIYTTNLYNFNDRLLRQGIRAYYNGNCYYNWPIRHWDQPDVLLGRMEFGVVRNNVYYLEVTGILNIGEPWIPGGPEDPDPENPRPDEDEDAYLMVDISVLPWVVRYNDIEF